MYIIKYMLILILILSIIILLSKCKWFGSKIKYRLIDQIRHWKRKLSYMNKISIMDKVKAKEYLGIIHDVMTKHNIKFWLSEGTALGFRKEEDIVDWDDDVDIGFFSYDENKFIENVIPELVSKGFCLVQGFSSFYTLSIDDIEYDFDITGPNRMCITLFDKCEKILPYIREFDTIKIKNKNYNLPKEEYLIKVYGKNWRNHDPTNKNNFSFAKGWEYITSNDNFISK